MRKLLLSLILLTLASFSSAQVVSSGGTFIASGGALSGCSANSILRADASALLACGGSPAPTYDATNIRLQVGTGSTTQTGWILGYLGASGSSGLWTTSVSPTTANYTIAASGSSLYINTAAGGNVQFLQGGSARGSWAGAAGQGLYVIGGTATTDVQALSTTQTWNAAGVTFTGHKYTVTDTASAAGSLHSQWLGGAAGATNLMSLDKAGKLTIATTANGFNPGFVFNGGAYGFGPSGTTGFTWANGSTLALDFLPGILSLQNTSILQWSSTSSAATANGDTFLSREAAATIQMGADVNGAAVNQTFKAHDGITGTDIAGANLTLAGGRGTGNGTPGNVTLQTALPLGSSGTTAQTLAQRDTIVAKQFSLTSGAAATVAVVTLGNDSYAGGSIDYCIYGADATQAVSECGRADFAGIDVTSGAGGEVCTFTKVGTPAQAVSGATLATTFATSTGTDLCNLRVTSTITTIGSPVWHFIRYRIINHPLAAANVVTPQ